MLPSKTINQRVSEKLRERDGITRGGETVDERERRLSYRCGCFCQTTSKKWGSPRRIIGWLKSEESSLRIVGGVLKQPARGKRGQK